MSEKANVNTDANDLTFLWECVPRFWMNQCQAVAAASDISRSIQSAESSHVLNLIDHRLKREFASQLSDSRKTAKFQYALGAYEPSDFAQVMRLSRPVSCRPGNDSSFWIDEAARCDDHVARLILLACHFLATRFRDSSDKGVVANELTATAILSESVAALGDYGEALRIVEERVRAGETGQAGDIATSSVVSWDLELQYLRLLLSDVQYQPAYDRIAALLTLSVRSEMSSNERDLAALNKRWSEIPTSSLVCLLVLYAELGCDLGKPDEAIVVLQYAIGVLDDDWTVPISDKMAPNDRTREFGLDEILKGGNLPWLLRACGATDDALSILVSPDRMDPNVTLGCFAKVAGKLFIRFTRSLMIDAAKGTQVIRRASLTMNDVTLNQRLQLQTAILRCLRDLGRHQHYGLIAGAMYWPNWGGDVDAILKFIRDSQLEPFSETQLLVEVTYWFNRAHIGNKRIGAAAKIKSHIGLDDVFRSERTDCRLEKFLSADRDLTYVLFDKVINLLEREGALSDAAKFRDHFLRAEASHLIDQRLARKARHRFAMFCVKAGRQTTWHSQVISTLLNEFALQATDSAESVHRQLIETGLPAKWGLAWTSDVCHALAGMLRHCKDTQKAYQISGAFVRHFCLHCYEDWRQAVGAKPEEFRLADGRFESDVRSETLIRWAMLFANSAIELGHRDAGMQAAMLWGGVESTDGVTALDRLIHRAVRDSLQSTLPFDWIECFLNAFCGDPSAPRLSAHQITGLFQGMDVGGLFDIFENDAFNAFLPPARRVRFFAWCLYVLDCRDPVFEPFCSAVVDAVRKVSFHELERIDDRRQMAETMNSLRWVLTTRSLVTTTENERGTGSVIAPERLLTLIEQLDNRILLEEMLLRRASERPEDKRHESPATSASSWGMTGKYWSHDKVRPQFTEWYSGIEHGMADLNGMALSACLGQFSDQGHDSTSQGIDALFPESASTYSVAEPQSLSEAASRPVSLGNVVPRNAIWIRTLFGNDGTLYWWALRRSLSTKSVEVIGFDQSEQSGARRRLELANLRLDAEIEAIWAVCSGRWNPAAWPSSVKFASSLKTGWKGLRAITDLEEQNEEIDDTRTALTGLAEFGLSHSATLGERFLDTVENDSIADEEREILYKAWENLIRILDARQNDTPFPGYDATAGEMAGWKDRALNRACERHRGTVAWELNLGSFFQSGTTVTSDSNVIFTVEGPLLAAPISSIPIAGKPLFSLVRSVTTSISLSFDDMARSTHRPDELNQNRKQILSAIWEEPERRVHVNGLPFLHAGVCDLADHEGVYSEPLPDSSERNAWEVVSLTDGPPLTPSILAATLKSGHYDIVVVGGHGHLSKSGVALARAEDSSLLWAGDGDFFQTDLVILCSCAVGRLNQHSGTDVAGLYTRIAANGGKTIVSARWLIDDLHAAYFILALLRHYMRLRRERGEDANFIRSEAFNEARKECYSRLEQGLPASEWHLFTSFDIYGLP